MRWLITGGCGFIGVNLVKSIIADGNQSITVLDNLCLGKVEDLTDVCDTNSVDIVVGDIRELSTVEKLCGDVDIIVHLAALGGVRPSVDNPKKWFENNTLGSFNVLEAARKTGVKKIICASSSAAVGDCKPPVHEDIAALPISPYGATKTTMESFCSAYYNSYGIDTVCLRFSNVYGKYSHRKEQLIPKLMKRTLSKDSFNIYGDGEQRRDFIHVDDLINVIKLCVVYSDRVGGEVFQLCSGNEYSVNTIVEKVNNCLKKYGIDTTTIGNVGAKVGDMATNAAVNLKIKDKLGWKPDVNIDDGVDEVVKWFIKRGDLSGSKE